MLGVAQVALAALAFIVSDTRIGHAAIVAAFHAVILAKLLRTAALRAGVDTPGVAMLAAIGAAGVTAVAAGLMIVLDELFAIHRIHARTMVRIAAGRLMAAEGVIAPEQTAHTARGMRVGVRAAVDVAAAALRRITEVLLIAFTDHVLRNGVAVLAHRLMQMRSHLAGKVAFHAAGR